MHPCGFCLNISPKSGLPSICNAQPTMEYDSDEPLRNDFISNFFQKYQLVFGECCDAFASNTGHWCGNRTKSEGAITYKRHAFQLHLY